MLPLIQDVTQPLAAHPAPDFIIHAASEASPRRYLAKPVDTILAKYKHGEGYVSYEKLTDADRNVLAVSVNTLAEDLSTLRGKLGLG